MKNYQQENLQLLDDVSSIILRDVDKALEYFDGLRKSASKESDYKTAVFLLPILEKLRTEIDFIYITVKMFYIESPHRKQELKYAAVREGFDDPTDFIIDICQSVNRLAEEFEFHLGSNNIEYNTYIHHDNIDEFTDIVENIVEFGPNDVFDEKENDWFLPSQYPAPIEAYIKNKKISLRKSTGITGASADDTQLFFVKLRDDIKILYDELILTNCDRRFISYIERLRANLDLNYSDFNSIDFGISLQHCDSIIESYSDQMPDIIAWQCRGFCASANLFVLQFSKWRQFFATAKYQLSAPSEKQIELAEAVSELMHDNQTLFEKDLIDKFDPCLSA